METLFEFQEALLRNVPTSFFRFLYHQLPLGERMVAIKGPRGSGKTTLLLQLLKLNFKTSPLHLYVTADHPYFYTNNLFELAGDFYRGGGRVLFIDEVHQAPNWSRELKNVYDGYPELQIFLTASSALDMYRGTADLSRRLLTYELPGLSLREYVQLMYGEALPRMTLKDLVQQSGQVNDLFPAQLQPLPVFREYLVRGYLPIIKEVDAATYGARLIEVTNAVLERDLQAVQQYSAGQVQKIKRLLGVIAESVPFEPNILQIAQKLQLGRDTVNNFIQHLAQAKLLNLVNSATKGVAALQKPDKIYLENTNLSYALKPNPNIGALRETFFVNQLRNAGHTVQLAPKGDFLIDQEFTFEIGGRNKDLRQLGDQPKSFLALDDLEAGYGRKIPLWAFGFLY